MRKLTRSWPSLMLMLALGLIGTSACSTPTTKPKLGPEFIDKVRDLEGSVKRNAEYFVVCTAPQRKDPPEPPLAPAWCAWTMQANKSIRANNAIARDAAE